MQNSEGSRAHEMRPLGDILGGVAQRIKAGQRTNSQPEPMIKEYPSPRCPKCLDFGSVKANPEAMPGDPDFGRLAICECWWPKLLKRMQTKEWPRYGGAKASDFPPALWNKAVEVIENGSGLWLPGPNGAGKTHLAAALTWHFWTPWHGRIVSFTDVLETIRRGFDQDAGYVPDDIIDSLKQTPWLVIDDLGAEKLTRWVSTTLYRIIDYRWNQVDTQRTIVTTNLTIEEFRETYNDGDDPMAGSRLASRFAGMTQTLEIMGRDRRLDGR